MDEARQPGGDAPGDRGADGDQQADRPCPSSDWAADVGWPPEDAEWPRHTSWAEPAWNAAGPGWSDRDLTATPAESVDRPERGSPGPDADDRAEVLDPVDARELDPIQVREPAGGREAIDGREPLDARRRGSAWSRLAPADRSWAELSARYSDLLPPFPGRPDGREGFPSNDAADASPIPQPGRPPRRPVDPASPPSWPGPGTDPSPHDRAADDPAATPPAIPLPRSAPPAGRSPDDSTDPLTPLGRDESGPAHFHRADPMPPAPTPAPQRRARTPVEPAAPSDPAVAVGRSAVSPVPDSDAAGPQRSDGPRPTSGPHPGDRLDDPMQPVGWTPPGVFVSRRQTQLDDERSGGGPRRLPPPPAEGERPAPTHLPTPQPSPAPPPRPTGTVPSRPGDGESDVPAERRRDADQIDPARITPARPSRPPVQPIGDPAGAADTEVLPQRVPAEPDVPTVPEPTVDPPAETPELARIATHLRRSDSALPHERPEGFDVNAILSAVREVPGVADASVRTTPAGAHKLRLDLADGADSAEVSRQVARLLQERMGLAAAPPDPEGADLPPAPAATSPDDAGSEPIVPRRRRTGSHRGRATVVEQPATGLSGTAGRTTIESGPGV
ncbi:MAG TPA: hypothetical protein VHN18_02550, partial [Micromonosporaceae bacterium]|nr:hypothetical protein [Micromonosporaceae bacterium]